MDGLFDLKGKVAIVTGASRGIGLAIARHLRIHGAKVVVASRKQESVDQVASDLGDFALPIAAHMGREEDCKRLVEQAIRHFGKVDILVNNAGTNLHFGPFFAIEEVAYQKIFELNVNGYRWMAREVIQHLLARGEGGSIINVASVAGIASAPLQGAYGMSKAAVISMTRTLAFEVGGANIRVNAIAPGLIDTRLSSTLVNNEAICEEVTRRTPLGRIGQPGEIAGAVVFLASSASSFMTGQVLALDGGMGIS